MGLREFDVCLIHLRINHIFQVCGEFLLVSSQSICVAQHEKLFLPVNEKREPFTTNGTDFFPFEIHHSGSNDSFPFDPLRDSLLQSLEMGQRPEKRGSPSLGRWRLETLPNGIKTFLCNLYR